jgi:hypothetical protein
MEVIGASAPLKHTEANNIALGKPVTTSSPAGFGSSASAGNDGNINGDFSAGSVYHSSNHSVGEYWQVDLGTNTPLAYTNLFSRFITNTTGQFDVEVFDSSMNLVDSVIVNNSDPSGPTPDYDHAIDLTGVTGRHDSIDIDGRQPSDDQRPTNPGRRLHVHERRNRNCRHADVRRKDYSRRDER